jgi:stage III sporulation protein AA
LTANKQNILINETGKICDIDDCIFINKREIDDCVNILCDGSYHTQISNIKNGFIITKDGYRIGVCGEIIYMSNKPDILNLINLTEDFIVDVITSINIRVNRFVQFADCPVINLIKQHGMASMLIYSPPSEGKTTLLRFLANSLSKGLYGLEKYRTALVDERREVYIQDKMSGGLLDVLYGYKKADGIECATRTMNPEVILCDEIGGLEDTASILNAQNSGVPFIATTHAGNAEQLMNKPNIKTLIENNIFSYIIGITLNNGNILKYSIKKIGE